MRIYYLFLAAAVLLISTAATAQQVKSESGPAALTIVLDSGWSNEHEMSDYISLSRQGIASLKPGDYVEIIVAASGKSKIRAAQFIKSGTAREVKAITSQLGRVSCPILSDGSLYKSVDLALRRLTKTDKNNKFSHATVIVFTDGKVNDKDVRHLQQLSKEFKKKNWSLCVTGTYHTNKKLLVAAHQGNFKFSLISDANPVLWIKRNTVINKQALPQASVSPSGEPDKKKGNANPTTTIGVEISVSQGEEQPADIPPATVPEEKKQKPEEAAQPEVQVEPDLPVPAEIGDKPAEKVPVTEDMVPSDITQKLAKKSNMLVWLLPLIAAAGLIVAVLLNSLSKARKWKSKVNSRLNNSQQKNQGTLIGKLNGQTYSLGRPDRINSIHIGSGPKNTIRIPDKSINDRHIVIYRKGNSLMLKNIGTSAVAVNGIQAKPKIKQKLVIPSSIEFNDKIKLKLELLRPKIASPNTRSNEDAGK
ncbi:MAG: FHA domain-containing protein [Planctomycetota bacterium]|jgi:hypothetical protein